MALAGAKPKPDGQKVTRVAPTHEWIDVVNEPYAGAHPDGESDWCTATQNWWAVVCRMPHAILWTEADWAFALDTAFLHDLFRRGAAERAAEVRIREKVLGTTADALRDLRIRYVAAVPETVTTAGDEKMADFNAERRRRLTNAE